MLEPCASFRMRLLTAASLIRGRWPLCSMPHRRCASDHVAFEAPLLKHCAPNCTAPAAHGCCAAQRNGVQISNVVASQMLTRTEIVSCAFSKRLN